jgi:multimeric flavodoxin WrbA
MKKVLIISTSLRPNANSEILARETERGALEAGNDVEFVTLKNKEINFCKGCLACQKLGHCVIDDDAAKITEKMRNSDVIVWATPVYYYEMSGQMKTLIDRANSLYAKGFKFKDVYLITTSADESEEIAQTVLNCLNGWFSCLPGTYAKGYINAGGLNSPNEVLKHKDLLEQAYYLGKNI